MNRIHTNSQKVEAVKKALNKISHNKEKEEILNDKSTSK